MKRSVILAALVSVMCVIPLRAGDYGAVKDEQAFRRELYASCMEKLGSRAEELTDDSALLELCGEPVHITPVTACNMKVTRPQDLAIAEAVLKR